MLGGLLNGLVGNPKLAEGAIVGILRMIPPEAWKACGGELAKLVAIAQAIKDQLARIESGMTEQAGRVDFLESVVRSSVPDAGVLFAERDMYQPDRRTHIGGIAIAEIAKPEKPANG